MDGNNTGDRSAGGLLGDLEEKQGVSGAAGRSSKILQQPKIVPASTALLTIMYMSRCMPPTPMLTRCSPAESAPGHVAEAPIMPKRAMKRSLDCMIFGMIRGKGRCENGAN
jgi:hypothetical protein